MVIEARRIESPSPNIQHDCAGCYGDAIEAALAGVVRDVGPTLHLPRFANPDRAYRVLGHFVETVAGFALGVIANHLTSGMRRWYGDDGVLAMRAAMHGWPAHERIETDGDLTNQLYVRFCHVSTQARALVAAVPDRPMTSVMLSLLAKEDIIYCRLRDGLALGWRVYCAAVTTKRYPPLDGSPSGRLWQAWVWQLDGRPVLTRDETEQAGYIMLVR